MNFIEKTAELSLFGLSLGWYWWLLIIFVICSAIDWITGSLAACKNSEWDSGKSRSGGFHKLGGIVAVVTSLILDVLLFIIITFLPIDLPFEHSLLFAPLVVVWYIVTELGSILENAGELGAPVPKFLIKALKRLKDKTDNEGEKMPFNSEDEKDNQ